MRLQMVSNKYRIGLSGMYPIQILEPFWRIGIPEPRSFNSPVLAAPKNETKIHKMEVNRQTGQSLFFSWRQQEATNWHQTLRCLGFTWIPHI